MIVSACVPVQSPVIVCCEPTVIVVGALNSRGFPMAVLSSKEPPFSDIFPLPAALKFPSESKPSSRETALKLLAATLLIVSVPAPRLVSAPVAVTAPAPPKV